MNLYSRGDKAFAYLNMALVNAFNITLLRKFFEALLAPSGEAARLDSTKEFQGLWKVFIPLSKPAIATISLFCIVARWNGFFCAMILVRDEDKSSFQVNMRKIIVELQADNDFGAVLLTSAFSFEAVNAAVMVCSILMVLIVYPFIQKSFNKGIFKGGVKEQ
ncbi:MULTISPECIES: ABC transporter permease subunit [Falsihalocynthiibacter]|uniref:ABC transporter permease subunit n=1 Tax=Falsihalocynthiibacter TaxID=2854182 RepID=UPI003001572A